MKKEAKKSEIEVLKERVEELGREIDEYITKKSRKIEKSAAKKYNRKYVWILVCLIIIILVIDIIALFAYYKPDLSGIFKSQTKKGEQADGVGNRKCSDGTPEAECSKNKPFFCYNGKLLKSALMCGCPSGYVRDFQDCVKA